MKIEHTARSVEMEGFDQPEHAFTIENNPLAFKVIASNIYSDKPLAVIRELGCNALDAHRDAGTEDRPFDIHLPNTFEPYFSIRDYGTGLSDANIKGLYSTFFKSTKGDDNKAIGMLGLGSKSPFAYAEQFNVTSFFEGTVSTYVVYYNAQGVPSLRLVDSQPTDEHNGLEINLAVNPDDFAAFADRARKVFHRFPVLPNLTGNKDADLTQVKYTISGPNYKVRSPDARYQYGEHKGAYAIQGTVAYPINAGRINRDMNNRERQLMRDLPIDIIFEIGELDIAPSREELSYDPKTQANIMKKVREVLAHLPVHAQTILADKKTLWEVKKAWGEWRNNDNSRSLRQVLETTVLTWNDVEIKNNHVTLKMYDHVVDKANDDAQSEWRKNKAEFHANSLDEDAEYTVPQPAAAKVEEYGDVVLMDASQLRVDRNPRASYFREVDIHCDDKTVIVWADDLIIARRLAKYIYETYTGQDVKVYGIRPKPGYEQLIKDQLGGYENFVMATTLKVPSIKIVDNQVIQREVKKLYKVNRFSTGWQHAMEKVETTHDVSLGGIYVVTFNSKVITPGQEWLEADTKQFPEAGNSDVQELLYFAQEAGLIKGDVYAFNSTHKALIKKHAGWENIFDVIKRNIIEKSRDKAFVESFQQLQAYATLAESNTSVKKAFEVFTGLKRVTEKVSKTSRFVKYMTEIEAIGKDVEAFCFNQLGKTNTKILNASCTLSYRDPKIAEILKVFDVAAKVLGTKKVDVSKAVKRANALVDNFRSFYPLLGVAVNNLYRLNTNEYTSNYATGSHAGDEEGVVLYIKLCDKGAGLLKEYKTKYMSKE